MKKGWQEKSVGDILQLEYGKPLEQSDRKPDGRFPVYGANGEKDRTDKFYHDKPSIIVGRKGSAGEINLTEKKFWPLDVTYFVTFDEQQHDLQFLYYLLTTLELTKLAKGVKPGINRNEVYSQTTRVPPLAEQQRIVGLLDEAFEGLAIAKANAEKNLQNARALFESHLQSVFTQRGPGWVETTFEELIESNIIGLTKNSREQGEDKAWPYVKMNNITRDNRFDFSRFTCVDATAEEVSKFSLKDGDFLFNTRNSHELVGKSCIYESDSNDAVLYNNNIMRVRFQRGIDARFVLLAFSSKGVADELNALKSGTTNVSAIYFKDLKSLVIPVPPIAEQKKIAAKLDALSEETQRLARLYEGKHAALEALKKSLLHRAFTGEL